MCEGKSVPLVLGCQGSVRQHHLADRAVLPGNGVPSLDFVVRGPDMAAVHSPMTVRTLTAFGLHTISYTIFWEEKTFGRRIDEFFGHEKEGRWTWWPTTS